MSDDAREPLGAQLEQPMEPERVQAWWGEVSRQRLARRRAAPWPWVVGTALATSALTAAAVLVIGGGGGLGAGRGALAVERVGAAPVLGEVPLAAHARIAAPDGSRLELGPDAALVPLIDDGREVRALLERGAVTLDLAAAPLQRWTLEAGLARIEPFGARVEVRRDAAQVEVVVERGVVLVHSALIAGHVQRVVGPGRVVVREADAASGPEPGAAGSAASGPRPESETARFVERGAIPESGKASEAARGAIPASGKAPETARGAIPESGKAPTAWRGALPESGEAAEDAAPAAAPPSSAAASPSAAAVAPPSPPPRAPIASATPPIPGPEPLRAVLARSDALRRQGQLDAAAALLDAAVAERPHDPLAALAALTLGRVQLERRDTAAAARAFERALDLRLPAALEQDALDQLVAAHEALGDRAAAERWRQARDERR